MGRLERNDGSIPSEVAAKRLKVAQIRGTRIIREENKEGLNPRTQAVLDQVARLKGLGLTEEKAVDLIARQLARPLLKGVEAARNQANFDDESRLRSLRGGSGNSRKS